MFFIGFSVNIVNLICIKPNVSMLSLQPSKLNDEKYQYLLQKILHDNVNITKEAIFF